MKIISLVENTSNNKRIKSVHGLSLYIETNNKKILFDVGPNKTLFKNAQELKIDLSDVDIVVISHGHMDHGGALSKFLKINSKAKIYIQKSAFEKHKSEYLIKINIGLKKKLINHPQVELTSGNYQINDELELFICKEKHYLSPINKTLYENKELDSFTHEHSLLIKENNKKVLLVGCAHNGILNIIDSVGSPDYVIGGFHLRSEYDPSIIEIANNIKDKEIKLYTCHCTSKDSYQKLKNLSGERIGYLACGEEITIL